MPLRVTGSDGKPTDPQIAVTPVGVQLEPGVLQIIGTGFFIARYGLLLTAKHVVDDIARHDSELRPTLTWLWRTNGTLSFRPIMTCSFFHEAPRDAADIAICQAVDSVKDGVVRLAEPNERIAISTQLPEPGTKIATYAYPDNPQVSFIGSEKSASIFADAFEGEFLSLLGADERFLRYPHVETSIEIRCGASGGPVFGPRGHAFAVNCRGWDLGQDHKEAPLSSVVPISLVLDLQFECPHLPRNSAEEQSVPVERRQGRVTLRDLAAWGHIQVY